jgi:hypothetical protein
VVRGLGSPKDALAHICRFVPFPPGMPWHIFELHSIPRPPPPQEDQQMLDHIGIFDLLDRGVGEPCPPDPVPVPVPVSGRALIGRRGGQKAVLDPFG